MKKRLSIGLLGALFASQLWAAPYSAQNVIKRALHEDSSIDFSVVEEAVSVLQKFAGDYPVQFDSEDDRKLALADNTEIAYLFHILQDSINPEDPKNYPLFLIKARNAWVAHNLDVEGGREIAAQSYLTAIALAPEGENAELHEELGRFLSSAALIEEGEKYLRQAYETRPQSAFPLALNLIAQKDKPEKLAEGLSLLKTFVEQNPNHSHAKEVLDAVENNRLEFKIQKPSSTPAITPKGSS
ncbi:MAG: hypothetical protein Q4B71_05945 [Cardiobacteriaceae bacterium]|nr:hypothetical protein [Cardiobacteriaceae bacterium]